MDRKEFRRRLVNYYVHPEMFLMPIKKKVETTHRIYVRIYAMAYNVDTNTYIFGNKAAGMAVMINTLTNKRYRSAYNAYSNYYLLPSGKYKMKIITACGYGCYVDNVWYNFDIDNDGKVSVDLYQNITLSSLQGYPVINVYLPISYWKFHIYYNKDFQNNTIIDTPRSGVARPDYIYTGEDGKLNYAELSDINLSINVDLKGSMICDLWLDEVKIANKIPFCDRGYYDVPFYGDDPVVKIAKIGNNTMSMTSNIKSRVPIIEGTIKIETNGVCFPQNPSNNSTDFSYGSKLTITYNEVVNTSSWRTEGSSTKSLFCPAEATKLNDLAPSDEFKWNYKFDTNVKITVDENTFTSNFEKNDFAFDNIYASYWPKRSQLDELAPPNIYSTSGYQDMFSYNSWNYIKQNNISLNAMYSNVCSGIINNVASIIMKELIFDQIEINNDYLMTHTLIIKRKAPPIKKTINYNGFELLVYDLSEAVSYLKVNSIYGSYENMEKFLEAFGAESSLIDYTGSGSEIVFSSETIMNTAYAKAISGSINYGIGRTASVVVGTTNVLGENANECVQYVGAYAGATRTNDYDEWINDPDVVVFT